jgi:predicted transcriptional regulator
MPDSEQDMRTAIFVDILKSCINGATKNQILGETSPLTHEQLRRITAELVDKDLIRYIDVKGVYITTDRGYEFLNQHKKFEKA